MNDNITQTAHLAPGATYNAYNGNEALKMMMKEIFDFLEQHQDFHMSQAYTRFGYRFRLEFTADRDKPTVADGSGHFERAHTVVGSGMPAPDDGRRKAGLVVPQPTLTAAGLVDIPLQKQ